MGVVRLARIAVAEDVCSTRRLSRPLGPLRCSTPQNNGLVDMESEASVKGFARVLGAVELAELWPDQDGTGRALPPN
jgi:hypothetical protein